MGDSIKDAASNVALRLFSKPCLSSVLAGFDFRNQIAASLWRLPPLKQTAAAKLSA